MKKFLVLKVSMIAFLVSCAVGDDYNPETVGLSSHRLRSTFHGV